MWCLSTWCVVTHLHDLDGAFCFRPLVCLVDDSLFLCMSIFWLAQTQEALEVATFVHLLQTKQVHYLFVKGVSQDCHIDAMGASLRGTSGWGGEPKVHKVSVKYADQQTVEMTTDGQGGSLKAAPGTSAELRGRAACLTLQPDGRAEMPAMDAESKDTRVMDAQTLQEQQNLFQESLASDEEKGWQAELITRTDVDHSGQQRLNISSRTAVFTRHRLDMPNAAQEAQACQGSEAYPILSGVAICVGQPCDVRFLLSEMPPASKDAPGAALDTAGQLACLHSGLAAATAAAAAAGAADQAERAKLTASVPTAFEDIVAYVEDGKINWAGNKVGDVAYRRVPVAGLAALKKVLWKPSLHCQKPSLAIRQLTTCMHPQTEKPIEAMMNAARPLFTQPQPAKIVVAELWRTLAVWSLLEARAFNIPT